MNLFVTSFNPLVAAKNLCNTHIIKMASESATMLLWPLKEIGLTLPNSKNGEEVKLSHKNHPVTIWTATSYENYTWHFLHFTKILKEYKARYKRPHYAEIYWKFINDNKHKLTFRYYEMTPFARCFSSHKDNLLGVSNTISAYRKFYYDDKKTFAKWQNLDNIPFWWPERDGRYVDKSFVNGSYIKR